MILEAEETGVEDSKPATGEGINSKIKTTIVNGLWLSLLIQTCCCCLNFWVAKSFCEHSKCLDWKDELIIRVTNHTSFNQHQAHT